MITENRVVLRQAITDTDGIDNILEIDFNGHSTIDMWVEQFMAFSLAAGFHPESVKSGFNIEEVE